MIGKIKTYAIISLALTAHGCTLKPGPLSLDPPGSLEYKAGFKDGCESGLATYGTIFYKMRYGFYQNYEMLSNVDYDRAWHESFNYCRHYNLKYQTHHITTN